MSDAATNWETSNLTDLIGHLLQHHHPYTKAALNDLSPLLDKVLSVHGDDHPELTELASLFRQLRDDLEQHLMKEEHILFPYMLKLEAESSPMPPPFGTIENPIRMMTMEHCTDGAILHKMLGITDNFALPPGACASFTALYQGLHALVNDLFQHIYQENNILFVKAIELEKIKLGRA